MRHPFTQVGHKTKVTRLLTRPTWGMKWGSFGYIVFHKDGCTLIDKCFHTLRMSLKGSQIQRSAAFLIPDVQVYQRLQKDFQGLVVTVVGLQRRNQQLKCSLSLNPTAVHLKGWASQVTEGDYFKEHMGETRRRWKNHSAQTLQLRMNFLMLLLFCQITYSKGSKYINVFLYLYLLI